MNKILRAIPILCVFIVTAYSPILIAEVPPVTVSGNRVLFGGQAKSLAGNSFFWSNTGWGQEKYYNADVVRWLKNDWRTSIVRAAMGVEVSGGYLEQPIANRQRVEAVVDAAIEQDLYVIIDYHTHHAERYRNNAIEFFQDMARKYGNNSHVIYEIYNEPLNVSWSNVIKPYAEQVISAIRAIDPDNLIIVGTPHWSQYVDEASLNPIVSTNNIAYALHFYAGSHGQQLRDKAVAAMDRGIALFATEWGTVNANGDGAVSRDESNRWMDFLRTHQISHLNWAISEKQEGASIVKPGASATGNWHNSILTPAGIYAKDVIGNWSTGTRTQAAARALDLTTPKPPVVTFMPK